MLYTMMHGKIHRATVTEANLEYMGSVTIDSDLMQMAGILQRYYRQRFNAAGRHFAGRARADC